MRFAGTWKQYSKKAMPQLAKITFHSASLRNFRCPYHATVMKTFEMVSRRIVRICSRCSSLRVPSTSRDLDENGLSQVAPSSSRYAFYTSVLLGHSLRVANRLV